MSKQAIGGGVTGPGGTRLPFPKAVRAGDFVFVSGQMAIGADGQLVEGGIEVQARQVMDNIQAILAKAGCSMDDVVKCNVFLTDISHFREMNEIYRTYFKEGNYPARTTVEAKFVAPPMKVEIDCIAYKPKA